MIDRFAHTNKLNNANPTVKVVVSLVMLLSVFFINEPLYMAGVFGVMVGCTLLWAKIPVRIYLHTLIFDSLFIIPGALALLFTIASGSRGSGDYLFAFNFFQFTIGITATNLVLASLVFCRAMAGVSCMLFLIYTTPVMQIAGVMKKAHISNTFLEIFVLTYRFIFDYWDKLKVMATAQELRFGYRNLKVAIQSIAMMLSNLFLMAIQSYEEMTQTLELKQYQGDFHVSYRKGLKND
ncbi:cobalt ECF transporter T component CbiQ [Acetobacterium carbinolicum]|jgi:cobalt/nickel transport system permease protein|uniref:cobalt ECF transporter T component CbiQ n=1 Tax=Acetobacterium carbinolicum TaxID=52690 RepID=UPI0039C8FB0F